MIFDNLDFETVYRAYPNWLMCAYNYYHEEKYDVIPMSDEAWTHMGYYFLKHIERIQYLKSIDFQGNTLGVYGMEELEKEIDRAVKEKELT